MKLPNGSFYYLESFIKLTVRYTIIFAPLLPIQPAFGEGTAVKNSIGPAFPSKEKYFYLITRPSISRIF
jgi:hypothetical protein